MSTTTIINQLFQLEVSKGNVEGTASLIHIGERESIAVVEQGEDIWHGTATSVPIPTTAGEQMTIVSTDGGDTGAGAGVQQVIVEYLDSSGAAQEETITLTGVAPIDTTATDITFVNAIHATRVGANSVATGNITIYQKGDAARVYNQISVGGNMSLTINYKVPISKTLHLSGWTGSASGNGKRVTLRLRANVRNNVIYDGDDPVFIFVDTMNLEETANSNEFGPYIAIPATAIIKISAWVDAGGGGAFVSGSIKGYLVDD